MDGGNCLEVFLLTVVSLSVSLCLREIGGLLKIKTALKHSPGGI